MPAGEDVHLGLVEHVAHVQAAGDVGGREKLCELLGVVLRTARSRYVEQVLVDPGPGPAGFDFGGFVGFWELSMHGA